MWPIGHVAVAYLCWAGYERFEADGPPDEMAVIAVVFGGLFPDLIDKPLAWQFDVLPTGRSLAHSMLVLLPLIAIVTAVAWRYGYGETGVAFGIGVISHPLVDAAPVLWRDDSSVSFLLYPLTAVEPYSEGPPSVWDLVSGSFADPYFLFEFVLLGIALVVWYRRGFPGVALVRSGGTRTD